MSPNSFTQRTLYVSPPQLPEVRLAKNRNVGCSKPRQNQGLTAFPPALMLSDLAWVPPPTFQGSLPVTTEPFETLHPPVPDSKLPPLSRL